MRLSNDTIKLIKQGISSCFGNVEVYLFGSRADDNKTGGDIDIAIKIDITKEEFKKRKISFLTYLLKKDFAFNIDIIHLNSVSGLILQEINKTAILL